MVLSSGGGQGEAACRLTVVSCFWINGINEYVRLFGGHACAAAALRDGGCSADDPAREANYLSRRSNDVCRAHSSQEFGSNRSVLN
ncbi:hypothetical protein D3C80_1455170 [compost metagenome]